MELVYSIVVQWVHQTVHTINQIRNPEKIDHVECECGFVHSDVLVVSPVDWLQSLKQFFINVSYHKLAASLTPMALF